MNLLIQHIQSALRDAWQLARRMIHHRSDNRLRRKAERRARKSCFKNPPNLEKFQKDNSMYSVLVKSKMTLLKDQNIYNQKFLLFHVSKKVSNSGFFINQIRPQPRI